MVGKDLIMATLFGGGSSSSGSGGGGAGGGWPEVPEDGATYLYITLGEGRASPMIGLCFKGTATVDWGDGTAPDELTSTNINSTTWTSPHSYAAPGDYVVRIAVNGLWKFTGSSTSRQYACILRHANQTDGRNQAYQNSIKRAVIGNGSDSIGGYAFHYCQSLSSIVLPSDVRSIPLRAFANCVSLSSVVIPSSVKSISAWAFDYCTALTSVVVQSELTSIGVSAFGNCNGAAFYDFTACTAVPVMEGDAFSAIPSDCEIRVPAALYDEWIAATNWATYADNIKAY